MDWNVHDYATFFLHQIPFHVNLYNIQCIYLRLEIWHKSRQCLTLNSIFKEDKLDIYTACCFFRYTFLSLLFFSKLNCYYNCYCNRYCNYFWNCYCNYYWNYYCNCNHDRHNLRLWVGLGFLLSFKLCSGTRNNPHQNQNLRHCHF